MLGIALVALLAASTAAAGVLEGLDDAFDELMTHKSLRPPSFDARVANVARPYGEDEDDYNNEMTSLEDEDVPHPALVNNWGADLELGQVGGVAVTNDDEPVVFHRGCHKWDRR